MRNLHKIVAGSMLIVLLGVTPVLSQNTSAGAVVEGFQSSLLKIMRRAKVLGVQGRFDALKPVIEKSFHQSLMIATASAPYWKAGSSEDRTILLSAFRRMSASTLATLFDGYSGEKFQVLRERKVSKRVTIVDTQIVRTTDEPVGISYVVADLRGRSWIIDVIVSGGISEVKSRRSEYSALLKKGGLLRLAEALDLRAERLLAGKEKAKVR